MSTRTTLSIETAIPCLTKLANPWRATVMLYAPVGRLGNVYAPASLVCVSRVWPVPVCVALTEAPGTTAPDVSVTVPTIDPYRACARRDAGVVNSVATDRVAANIWRGQAFMISSSTWLGPQA